MIQKHKQQPWKKTSHRQLGPPHTDSDSKKVTKTVFKNVTILFIKMLRISHIFVSLAQKHFPRLTNEYVRTLE